MEEKEPKTYYNQSVNKAVQKYTKENLEQIAIRVKKGKRDYYKNAADKAGMSFAEFVTKSMDEKIERDGL